MHMLLQDSALDAGKVNLYKGIILLSNRSSYEVIQNFLPGHVKDSFFYFVRLNIPPYNVYNGMCPGCELVETYDLMHRRSSTHEIAEEYERAQ